MQEFFSGMKKIYDGKDNPDIWKGEYSCTGEGWEQDGKTPCGAKWEIKSNNIFRRKYKGIDGMADVYYGFICPDCGCFTEIKESTLKGFNRNMVQDYEQYRLAMQKQKEASETLREAAHIFDDADEFGETVMEQGN